MTNDFVDAVKRLPHDRPKQYAFTVEVIVREEDLNESELEDGATIIRQIGSFEVVDVQELTPDDDRRI